MNNQAYDELKSQISSLKKEVSSQKTSILELEKSEKRYKDILENANDLIHTLDPEGRFLFTNKLWQKTLGYSKEEIKNMKIFDVIDPEFQSKCTTVFECMMRGEQVCPTETVFLTKDGRKINVEGRCNPKFKHGEAVELLGIFRDISDRKRSEKEILESRARFQMIYENAPIMIDGFDQKGNCILWNKQCEKYLGWSCEEAFTDKNLLRSCYPVLEEYKNVENSIKKAHGVFNEFQVQAKDGSQRIQMWANFRLHTNIVIAVGYDITEKKEDERKLKEAQVQLIHNDKMAALGRLVAGIAHELNNNTNFIVGAFPSLSRAVSKMQSLLDQYELIDMSAKGDNLVNQLGNAKKAVVDGNYNEAKNEIDVLFQNMQEGLTRNTKIIYDLMSFSHKRGGKLFATDIHEELEKNLRLLSLELENKVEIIKEFDQGIPKLYYYPDQLNQVFMNILLNAIYAIERSGTIWIETKRHKDLIQINIRDSGPGIPEDIYDNIFDPFFTTRNEEEGTGLGLSISYGIIKNHHGEIKVLRKTSCGAEVQIFLPIDLRKLLEEIESENQSKSS